MGNSIELLLSETGSIIKKYEAIAYETGANFNIFEIADISAKETTVCRVLTELLSPTGHHGQKGAYLEIFLRDCLKLEFDKEAIEKARVHREYPAGRRRIDIVIEIGNRFIPIEVKIYAGEGVDQCYDYLKFANKKDKDAKVVYLTLDGHTPSEYSAKNLSEDDVLPISFATDILSWLEKCIALPDTIRKAPIREILIQFISTIKRLTNQLEDKPKMEMIQLLSKSSENMRNAEAIVSSLNACKSDMIFNLLKAIEKGIGREKLSHMDYEENGGHLVKTYYDKKHPNYPSLNYLFAKVRKNVEIWFKIEVGWDLYAGLCVVTDGEHKGWTLTDEECERFNVSAYNKKDDWWSNKWTHLPSEDERPHFKNTEVDNFYKLFDKDYFDEFVEKCVTLINNLWNEWENDMK